MEVIFSPKAVNDINYWKNTNNVKVQSRITQLLESIIQNPFAGLGKPEPLKYNLKGYWSRRIDQEHRLVYEIKNNEIHIISLRGHY
jgi:toxin YoeB